jgi:tetratricopeptide (TPR) repeat protein
LKPVLLAEPVLVGREHELEQLQAFLDSAMEGKGNTIFISGEAGSGKTRLSNEFLELAKNKNAIVLSGWCLSNVAIPYFPFVEAFASYSSNGEWPDAQQLQIKTMFMGKNLNEEKSRYQIDSVQAWKDQAFATVIKELLFLSSKKTVVLFIDDIQWADSASLALIHYIARVASSERILVLATFRSEEMFAKKNGQLHPLVETLQLMGREGIFREIKIENLSTTDVGRIAESMLGGSVNSDFVNKLSAETRGNPLFVVESLRMIHEQDRLVEEDGQWNLLADKIGIPAKVKDVILRRIATLKDSQKRILETASVVGEKFDPDFIALVVAQEKLDVFETLNLMEKTTRLVVFEGSSYRFSHAKVREMIYGEIPFLVKKELHSKIAIALENNQASEKVTLSEVAYHFTKAGDQKKAVKYSLQAGKLALSKYSNAEAIKHFKFVLESVDEDPKCFEERISALEGLGDALYANSMFSESIKVFENLGDVTETGVVRLRALRKAMESAFQLGHYSQLMELTKKAQPYASADRLESARVLFSRGRAFLGQGLTLNALEDYKVALQVFEEEYSLWDVAWALIGTAVAQGILDIRKEGIAAALRSIALFKEIGDFRWLMEAYWAAGLTFNMCLLEHEALDLFARVIEIDEEMKMSDYIRLYHANVHSAMSFDLIGDYEKALSYSLKALELSKKTDSIWAYGKVYSYLSSEYALLGDVKRAEEYYEKLMKLPPEILIHPSLRGVLPKAVLFAAKCRWKESDQYFKNYFVWLKDHPIPTEISLSKQFYAWSLKRQGRFEEAMVQLEENKERRRESNEEFEHTSLAVYLMASYNVAVGEEFEIRLDIVNSAKNAGRLVKIEGLIPHSSKVVSVPSFCKSQSSSIDMNQKRIGEFQVETIKLSLIITESGIYKLDPCVSYIDDLGETRTCKARQSTITAQLLFNEGKSKEITEASKRKFEFKSEAAEKTFSFLISAFIEDYKLRRLLKEKSGWRTLMQIVKSGHTSKHSLYGQSGRGGEVMTELGNLELVETRFFLGERGRGGRVLKARIRYEKEFIRQQIDQDPT